MIAEEPPYAPASRRARRWPIVLLLAIALFLAGVAAAVWAFRDPGMRDLIAEEPESMTNTAAPMPVAAVTPPPIVPTADPAATETADALDERVAALEARIDQVGRRAQSAAGDAARAEGLLVAFAARRALDRGLGLGYLEGQLNDRFGTAQPLAVRTVIAAARDPVTIEDLQLDLEEIAPALGRGSADEGWFDGVRRNLSELIVIRRAGTPSPLSSERLRRARRMLEGGRVDAAMAEVARMPGRDGAAAWLTDARRYVAARRALDVLETAALLAQQPQPGAAGVTQPAVTDADQPTPDAAARP
ncbi:hypothetical protein GGR88_002360 [Sphingomonas jejuensis]|uniref:Inner membrane protein n=1 Tax=Sphingomonas jejuensis TaxID=904715 RepID=A0ABX0XQ72_9SPHN|nr:hypothetical protein [Sphingomonas jejuensis]NJC34846.1 hypothetical protein [Sphingomonas jejuensis]